MKHRIYHSMVLLVSLGIILVSSMLCAVFYEMIVSQVRDELKAYTKLFQNNHSEEVIEKVNHLGSPDLRITLIEANGSVAFDTTVNPKTMDNHLKRQEVKKALATGTGESDRYSDTVNMRTFYYAIQLTDGSILRVAKNVSSIWAIFANALPIILVFIIISSIISYFVANRLAKRVVAPLLSINIDKTVDVPYAELAPYAREIEQNREQIASDKIQLKRRSETINAIMTNMDEGVILLDRSGEILSMNKSAANIFCFEESMEGHSALELLQSTDLSKKIQGALNGNKSELAYCKEDKEYRLLISPVAETGVIVLFLDVTEKSESERLRREFSANVSHELKTPLTSIYGHAEMLKENVVREDDKPLFYHKIMNEAFRLIALIEDIILLSELDENRVKQHFIAVNLSGIAVECQTALEQKVTKKNISVTIHGDAEMLANHSLIYDMLYNLLDNAITYSDFGGEIKIFISEHKDTIEIRVSDNGMGISAKDQKRIFERFYRAEKSRSKKTGGTGLGLAIVKHIVLLHQGTIRVESVENKGTSFIIVFPKNM